MDLGFVSVIISSVNVIVIILNHNTWISLDIFIGVAFAKGCLGGFTVYCGKDLIRASSNHDTYNYVWGSKILNALGTTIINNGANNEKLFNTINFQLWFLNCNYNKNTGLNCRADLVTLGGTLYFLTQKDINFDFKTSLLTNTVVFNKKSTLDSSSSLIWYKGTYGASIGNTILKKKVIGIMTLYRDTMKNINGVMTKCPVLGGGCIPTTILYTMDKPIALHEMVHTEQYFQYSVFNSLYELKIKSSCINSLIHIILC